MPKKPKPFPFVVLAHGPKVIYTCCVEGVTDKSLRESSGHQVWFGLVEILLYVLPAYIVA